MAEGLQRPRSRLGCFVVLTAALVAAVFTPGFGFAQARTAAGRETPHAERSNANTVAIISGNPNETYLSIAYDLSVVLNDGSDFRVLPIVGTGGAQNLRDIRDLKGVDLGMIQSVILNAFRNNKKLGDIDRSITYIAKLYNEELHLVVRADSGITAIQQLDGKKVNFSDVGSGTQLSARDIFERLGVKPIEVNTDQADALKQLEAGEIAATVLIAGKPAGLVTNMTAAAGFRLLPVPFAKELHADYLPAKLTSQDYPDLVAPDRPVDTVATGAVLIAYNWPRNTDHYRRIAAFVDHFFPRLADFQKPPRHPKWRETNLAAVMPGWKRFPAAEEWLQRYDPGAPQTVDQREQFNRFLKAHPQVTEAMTSADRDRLYQEFLQWNEARQKSR
jgi:TRAP transporter TAXI family solute receptor